jgi:hypothetical protein
MCSRRKKAYEGQYPSGAVWVSSRCRPLKLMRIRDSRKPFGSDVHRSNRPMSPPPMGLYCRNVLADMRLLSSRSRMRNTLSLASRALLPLVSTNDRSPPLQFLSGLHLCTGRMPQTITFCIEETAAERDCRRKDCTAISCVSCRHCWRRLFNDGAAMPSVMATIDKTLMASISVIPFTWLDGEVPDC